MSITHNMKKLIVGALLPGALLGGGLGAAGLGLGAGTANANLGPFTWCPGQSMDDPIGPNRFGTQYGWDMSVCHTWYRVDTGYGNVLRVDNGLRTLQNSSVWDGNNPPANSGVNCGPLFCPVPPHQDPNFHG